MSMPEYFSNIKYANLVGISRVAIGKAVNQGRIIKTPKGIDPNNPINKYYVQVALEKQALGRPKPPKKVVKKKKKRVAVVNGGKPEEKKKIAKAVENHISENPEYDIDLDDLEMSVLGLPPKAKADLKKIIEQVKLLELRREEKRKQLIPRDLVRNILSKMYIIENNEFKPLGTRVAPDIAAICEVDDPAKILLIDERIEAEVYKILEHMKIEINRFLKKQEERELDKAG